MSSKRNARKRQCRGKQAYTADKANAAAAALGNGLQAYKCRECSHYHVGHPRHYTQQQVSERRRSG